MSVHLRLLWTLSVLSLTGPFACAAPPTSAMIEEDPDAGSFQPEVGTAIEPLPAGFVVHEWGTFTSMQDSTGAALDGLHHTEEFLPPFVYGRDRVEFFRSKSMESLPEAVTQKLETPVIYFYNDKAMDARVEVDFPEGVISEWYPNASSFAPAVGELTGIQDGKMTWDVSLQHEPLVFPEVAPDDIWAPSRKVPAAMNVTTPHGVENGQAVVENEKFIFYRGLGRFDLPITVTSDSTTMTVRNPSNDDIPALFFIHVHEGGGAIVPLGSLEAGAELVASPSPKEIDLDAFVQEAALQVERALIDTGLYPDEARAMVDTWRHSYFRTPGLRLLYIVPRAWTDKLLPIRVTPQPDELVRTLVGRVEVLLYDEEQSWLQRFTADVKPDLDELLGDVHGRFVEPRLWRMLQLTNDPETQGVLYQMIADLEWKRVEEMIPVP